MLHGLKAVVHSISATPQGTVLNSLHLSFGASLRAKFRRKIHEPARRILHWMGGQSRARNRQNGAQGRRGCVGSGAARPGRPRSFATYDWRERVRVGHAQGLLRNLAGTAVSASAGAATGQCRWASTLLDLLPRRAVEIWPGPRSHRLA